MNNKRRKILFINGHLNVGGVEKSLVDLLNWIDYSCYDRDHVKLKYPIKIVEKECSYEDAAISPSCPYQGYFYEEDMSEVEKAFHNLDKEVAKWKREQARKKQKERLK